MIGLDTNVVIRYIVQDDPEQSLIVNKCIEKLRAEGEEFFICQITLCEVSWVLERCYKIKKRELLDILKTLLQTKQIRIENDDIVWLAIQDYEETSKVGFSDCLIGRENQMRNCDQTLTLDHAAAKNLPFTFKKIEC